MKRISRYPHIVLRVMISTGAESEAERAIAAYVDSE